MYKIACSLVFLCLIVSVFGQAPDHFSYQAVLRNTDGTPRALQEVELLVELRQGSPDGPAVFTQVQTVQTDPFGAVTLRIGDGAVFSELDWELGPYFLALTVDGTYLGASQLLSVPYALYAREAGHVDDPDPDPANELQTLSIEEDVLSISGGNSVTLPDVITPWQSNLNGIHYPRNVGIGNYVTLPVNALDIRRDMTSAEDKALIRLQNSDIGNLAYVALGLETYQDIIEKDFYRSEFLLTSREYTGIPDFRGMTAVKAPGTGFSLWASEPTGSLRFYTTPLAGSMQEQARFSTAGFLGLGTTVPKTRLHVASGDVYVEESASGVVLRSPNGKQWRVQVDDAGTLRATEISLK
ncbi:MAG: hypothetical protein R2751_11180 [Bacteroidales bacterium]